MATLEDRILGEKLHYYCSSSSSEDEDDTANCDQGKEEQDEEANARRSITETQVIPESEAGDWNGSSVNTGPKGVLKDWQRYKQLESEKREDQEREQLALIKKLSMTCQSHLDEEKSKQKDDELDEELKTLLEDEHLKEYMQKRMEEMLQKMQTKLKFGSLIKLNSGQEFLDAVDKDSKSVTTVIHIYTHDNPGCEAMNGCLKCLAVEHPHIKFCCLEASSAGMSQKFEKSGVPALLVYRDGNLIGNFVRLTDEFGDDFFAVDVENFLIEHGMLPDQSLVPSIIKSSEADDEDSDFDVE